MSAGRVIMEERRAGRIRSAKITTLMEERLTRLYKEHCANVAIPVLAINAVFSKGRWLAVCREDDATIGAAMRQEAIDAARFITQVQP